MPYFKSASPVIVGSGGQIPNQIRNPMCRISNLWQ